MMEMLFYGPHWGKKDITAFGRLHTATYECSEDSMGDFPMLLLTKSALCALKLKLHDAVLSMDRAY